MDLYFVQGCGVSLMCQKGEAMLWWIRRIIELGGVPQIRKVLA